MFSIVCGAASHADSAASHTSDARSEAPPLPAGPNRTEASMGWKLEASIEWEPHRLGLPIEPQWHGTARYLGERRRVDDDRQQR
jgi:hypothetical protein